MDIYLKIYVGFFITIACMVIPVSSFAQCPVNIDFEKGDFDHWSFDTAGIYSKKVLFATPLSSPVFNNHVLYKRDGLFEKDPYGDFPVNCPNGSGYSIRIGNQGVGEKTGISYTINIPADKNEYSIIYNYALVLQNPNHNDEQQPRFTARVFDVETNEYLQCSSFDFAANSNLPGFLLSNDTIRGAGIVYKPWSPVTIKLNGYAGKKVRIEFVVNDCLQGGHFGYAYLDVNEGCASPVGGGVVCQHSTSTLLTAPFGFKEYEWYTEDFSRQLGAGNTLFLSPLPAIGTKIALQVKPYPGSGCVDTMVTVIEKIDVPFELNISDTAGACVPDQVDLRKAILPGTTQGLAFTYFNDISLTSFVQFEQQVTIPGTYFIKAVHDTGCITLKPVRVIIDSMPEFTIADPPIGYYPATTDITRASLITADKSYSYYYWRDAAASIPVMNPSALDLGGIYYIEARTGVGCSVVKPIQVVIQIPPPPNAFSPNGDGINDLWQINGLSRYPACKVYVYDRYGRIVFSSTGYNQPWDGTVNGKPVSVATYYYVIKTTSFLEPLSGSVTVLR